MTAEALGLLADNEGGYLGRVVKVVVQMTPPVMDELEVEIPDSAGELASLEDEPEGGDDNAAVSG